MGASVLIVEDDPAVQELLGAYLKGRGLAVRVSDDLKDALPTIRARAVEIVVTDLKLPDGSGLELLAAAREEGLRVIVLSGFLTVESAIAALSGGADAVLRKPCRLRDLHAAIVAAFETEASERQVARKAEGLALFLAAERAMTPEDADALIPELQRVAASLPGMTDFSVLQRAPGLTPLGRRRSVAWEGPDDPVSLFVAAVDRALLRSGI